MEADQREILIARRVELVEDIDIQGGLFTQLQSRKVLQKRTVNKLRLNRTPEEQVEELLNELPKRECFEDFCEALIADGQEHIVKKYLKSPLPDPDKSESAKSLNAAVSGQTVPESSPYPASSRADAGDSGESAESSADFSQAAVKRPRSSTSSSTAVICIREEDNQHVYIKYTDEGASPEKRKRALEAGTASIEPVTFEPDETRYAMKHYISQESGHQGDTSLVPHVGRTIVTPQMVMNNPQSIINNPNISDPLRYSAAFPANQSRMVAAEIGSIHPSQAAAQISTTNPALSSGLTSIQSSSGIQIAATAAPPSSLSSPLKDPSSQMNKQEAKNIHIRNLLRPQQGQNFMSIGQLGAAQPVGLNANPGARVGQFLDPQQYLNASGILNPSKTVASIYRDASMARSQNDAVDDGMMGSPMKTIPVNMVEQMTTVSALNDSLDIGLISENLSRCAGGRTIVPSPCSVTVGAGDGGLCDLDQIDLPDGCVNVKVEHCTKQFFLNYHKKAYPMRQIPRGLALIINVDEVEGKPARKGTNFDRDNLCNLLCQLHFNIIVYNDKDGLTAQEMVNKLKEFAKLPDHADMDACFVCLLSHGEEGFIFGTDGKRIPLEEIFMLFGNTNCKGLIGKPKVFIIQACRGGYLDKGVRLDEVDGGSLPASSSSPSSSRVPGSGSGAVPQQLPSMSDMLVCYPTLTGYYAWRNRARGSWYIEAIVQVFMRYAKCEDVCAMLNRVNQLVSKKVSECNQKEMNAMSQMSEYKSSLRQPHLFLFPGIGICMKPPM